MADHYASILRPRRCVCLHPASFERPVSDRPPRRPLCDCFEHAQNFTATMASMAMSERPMCHPWTTRQPFRLPSAFNGDLASFVVAQGRHKGRSPLTLFGAGTSGTAMLKHISSTLAQSPVIVQWLVYRPGCAPLTALTGGAVCCHLLTASGAPSDDRIAAVMVLCA